MLNIIQLKKITKDDCYEAFKNQIYSMNNHQFETFKKISNKKGVFDDVYK